MRKGKGKEAKLSYQASTLMENRNGLLVGVDVRCATGTSEREGVLHLIDEMLLSNGSKTIGGLRKLMRVGPADVRAWVTWSFAVYNLIRISGIEAWWNPSPT